MEEHLEDIASFHKLPDELIILIISYFDQQHQFWSFGFLSQRFLKLMPCKLIKIQVNTSNGESSVQNKISRILKAKEILESIEQFVITLTSANSKDLKDLRPQNRISYTLIITKKHKKDRFIL